MYIWILSIQRTQTLPKHIKFAHSYIYTDQSKHTFMLNFYQGIFNFTRLHVLKYTETFMVAYIHTILKYYTNSYTTHTTPKRICINKQLHTDIPKYIEKCLAFLRKNMNIQEARKEEDEKHCFLSWL